ncbi:LytTR family DNA-binding domain-containing protein [Rhizobium sp. FY34]|uniref:LytTR family DNA-binding domain-containing protein n=1 Tax=Rhizobium sp. FY34 TaxID=2562309 RepID=UPI0010C09658|nr:LytTR family DNA-binding domain-containing protein [Rhizobium sp. FY34]
MNAGNQRSTLRELQLFLRAPRFWLTIAAVVLLFTVTGPFGTRESMPLLQRLSFWSLLHGMAFCVAVVMATLANLALEKWIASRLVRMLIGSALAALPIGFGVMLLEAGFFEVPVSIDEALTQAAIALPLGLSLCFVTYLTTSQPSGQAPQITAERPVDEAPTARVACDRPALLNRLKPEQRGRLLQLSVEDHYTQVLTSRGRDLILLRFSDALNEVGDTPGQRIHRSHWVADEHVSALKRDKGKLTIITRDGLELPVSRPYEAQIRARYGKGNATEQAAATL